MSTSLITFGGYNLPAGAQIKQREVNSDFDEMKMLGIDGTFTPPGKSQAQVISVEIAMGGGVSSVTSNPIVTLDDLNNEANYLFAQLASGYQLLDISESPARQIMCQKQKFTISYLEATGRRKGTITVDFYAQDPRWLSQTVNTITASGSATNAGNLLSYPKVTFTGPSSGLPTVAVFPGAGTPKISVTVEQNLASGDVVVVDCDPRNRANAIMYTPSGGNPTPRLDLLGTTGIVNTVGDDATFPYLLPGANSVTLGGSAASVSFAWQDAYAL